MTTIAYKDGVIAYDSRSTAGDLISNDNFDKKFIVDGVVFIMSGATSDFKKFIDLYFCKITEFKNIDVSALVVDKGELFLCSVCDDIGLWKQPLVRDNPVSIGSGSNFALTAMDLGLSAVQAVKTAIKRDCKSGGKVRLHKL